MFKPLTAGDIASASAQFTCFLQELHDAGYAHGDIAERNMCMRHAAGSLVSAEGPISSTAAQEPQSLLQCRLIDLSSAIKLSALEDERQELLKRHDHRALDEVFESLRRRSCVR